PSEPAAPDQEQLAAWLRLAPVLGLERIPWGSNAVFEARLTTPGGEVRAIYKPARGERPLWDFPLGTLHRREVATSEVDRALGWGFTPLTVLRRQGPLGKGSMQEFIPDPLAELELDQSRIRHSLQGLAALDVLLNNADRKQAHLLIDPQGRVRGIDHGVTFHAEFKLRTALLELGGTEVPASWLADIRRLLQDPERLERLGARLRQLLQPDEVDAFLARARRLLRERAYPVLNQWYGRPFEW
ncbi:MAG: SCO1664 family protein, partial [Candidatus Dormibacteria bacterium]